MLYSRIISIAVLVAFLIIGGCGAPEMDIQVNIPGSNLIGNSRVNLITSNDQTMATDIRHTLHNMLIKNTLAASDPVLAEYGLNCDFTLTRRYLSDNNGQSFYFVALKVEFLKLSTGETVRKTVLHGHVGSEQEVLILVGDMVSGFFKEFSASNSFKVPVAKGWTGYDSLGRKQLAKGDVGRAIENFKLAIDARPDDHAAHYNLGVAYESLNRKDQAFRCYQRAYQIQQLEMYQRAVIRVSK